MSIYESEYPICPKHFVPMNIVGYSPISNKYYWMCSVDGCTGGVLQGYSSKILNLRMWVHALFDNIWGHDVWKGKMFSSFERRILAYDWLSKKMKKKDYHISHMNLKECWTAIDIVRNADLSEIFPSAKPSCIKRIKSKIEKCYIRARDLRAFEISNMFYEDEFEEYDYGYDEEYSDECEMQNF